MSKDLFIAEKPSVAQEFAKALKVSFQRKDGYMEAENTLVTWCVGHLVTMSYPEAYDSALKKWSITTLPFLPQTFKYEVIPAVEKQFRIVKGLLNRDDVTRIYVCTDSGREGEYIYRLVDQMAKVPSTKDKRRVWIDSQTEEEILRGIREAKPLNSYDNLSNAAYLRAKEDYLMGINFSRILSLKYGDTVRNFLKETKYSAIAVGRVMTCVLGMVVRREREIRAFVKTPFYRVLAHTSKEGISATISSEFRAVDGSKYYMSPALYKENGFLEKAYAEKLIDEIKSTVSPLMGEVLQIDKKKENKNAPLLFNLAELQNECSKLFKISPDETLAITQELYEKKLVTYPRTDARVLSTAVAKEITKNIKGLGSLRYYQTFVSEIMENKSYQNLAKTRYVNDKQITDHYAIIPTGQGLQALNSLKPTVAKVYDIIVKRFLSIFFPPAVYRKISLILGIGNEKFFASSKVLEESGYLKVAGAFEKKEKKENEEDEEENNEEATDLLLHIKKGDMLNVNDFEIKEGETAPPKRYNSGSLILAMENAGQFIEDEELRAQIKGSGIGTSATRAEILNKLIKINYLNLNKKTQIITPNLQGEMIYDVVFASMKQLLNAELTASWEKGLTYVAEGQITSEEYMNKLETFVTNRVEAVKNINNQGSLWQCFQQIKTYYK